MIEVVTSPLVLFLSLCHDYALFFCSLLSLSPLFLPHPNVLVQ
jgi:hypothetical protein